MANAPGGSFIPKRSTGKVAPKRAGRRIYIFSYIAYVFFFGTLLSVVGIFFLSQQAEKQLDEHIALLEQERQAFSDGQINEVRQLDRRLTTAIQVLDRHAAPSVIFDELESVIVRSVQINNFSYARESSGTVVLSLGGITENFDALMFQRDVMEQSDFLASADFVQVGYGAGLNFIEGADRENEQPDTAQSATVTFTFEDDSILERIGYQPNRAPAQNTNVPPQSPDATDTGTSTDAASDVTNNEDA